MNDHCYYCLLPVARIITRQRKYGGDLGCCEAHYQQHWAWRVKHDQQ